jgi:hypothetical protein
VEDEIKQGTQGMLNVMDYLGMYETKGERKPSQKLIGSSWVRIPRGKGGSS